MSLRLFLAAAVCAMTAAAQHIGFSDGVFRLSGLHLTSEPREGWQSVFPVYAGEQSAQPALGVYWVENGDLFFRPRFPPDGKVAWHAKGAGVEAVFDGAPQRRSARVERVYPSTDVLPANVLKLYIHFSAPMSRGEAWQHIRLLDENGKKVELAFVEIDQELWDPEQRRLTVLFDPGRIKRGLVPANELGTPIVEGRRYTLAIDKGWRDAGGAELVEEFRKSFRGGPVDREPADPALWRVTAPKAGSREPVRIDFPKPMDSALLERMIEVPGVEGTISLDRDETRWMFTPNKPWKAGEYRIAASADLEDICGNRVYRAFDVDLAAAPKNVPEGQRVILTFAAR